LVERLRQEVLPLVRVEGEGEGKTATLDISKLEEKCPLMVSCYKESIRLGNQGVGTRRVMHDTVLTDSKGQDHLLKAGVDVMWSAKRMHRMEEIWGDDAMEFNPERFREDRLGRAQKQAYIPFGGGKHLCPGRNFAFAENLGFMAALLVGFEVQGLEERNYKLGDSRMGEAVAKPPADAQGGEVVIKRREGWEEVEWMFVC
jgi:cytochrome P450